MTYTGCRYHNTSVVEVVESLLASISEFIGTGSLGDASYFLIGEERNNWNDSGTRVVKFENGAASNVIDLTYLNYTNYPGALCVRGDGSIDVFEITWPGVQRLKKTSAGVTSSDTISSADLQDMTNISCGSGETFAFEQVRSGTSNLYFWNGDFLSLLRSASVSNGVQGTLTPSFAYGTRRLSTRTNRLKDSGDVEQLISTFAP